MFVSFGKFKVLIVMYMCILLFNELDWLDILNYTYFVIIVEIS